jgi:serine O-acetyltransferase
MAILNALSVIAVLAIQIGDDWRANGRDWTRPGFRALAVHRFGVFRMGIKARSLRWPCSFLYRILSRHCRNVYGIELPHSVSVGRGVVIEHQGGIVIHGASVIGDRCVIRHGCTLGIRRMDDLTAAPILANDVQLGAGAVLMGRISIGEAAQVGANAVVTSDVPARAKALGNPAKIYPENRGMDAPGVSTIGRSVQGRAQTE